MPRLGLGVLALGASSALGQDQTRVLARLGGDRFHHEHPITTLAYSPDGKLLATNEGIFEVATGRRVHRFSASGVAWSADGRRVIFYSVLGRGGWDNGNAVAVDREDRIAIGGIQTEQFRV